MNTGRPSFVDRRLLEGKRPKSRRAINIATTKLAIESSNQTMHPLGHSSYSLRARNIQLKRVTFKPLTFLPFYYSAQKVLSYGFIQKIPQKYVKPEICQPTWKSRTQGHRRTPGSATIRGEKFHADRCARTRGKMEPYSVPVSPGRPFDKQMLSDIARGGCSATACRQIFIYGHATRQGCARGDLKPTRYRCISVGLAAGMTTGKRGRLDELRRQRRRRSSNR